jgi:hypothetical protein
MMRQFRQLSVLVLLFVPLLVAVFGRELPDDGSPPVTRTRLAAAIARGLDWIDQHPASVEDGGLTDILDEGVGFRVLSRLAGGPAARERFARRFAGRMAMLGALPEFAQWVNAGQKRLTDYYHLVLAAYLMQQAGTPSDLQPAIVAQAQWVMAATSRCDPTKRLTIALFLERLDEEPVLSLPAALAASRIERIARGNAPPLPAADAAPQQRRAATLELYALVHEIVALTDFGVEPPPPWLGDRRQPLQRYLVQAVSWAGAAGNIDLLSELLLTALFLDTPIQAILPDALEQLLSSQQDDGSWGPGQTSRTNRYRHAVFTATAALTALASGLGAGTVSPTSGENPARP